MSDATRGQNAGDEEDWVVLSPTETPATQDVQQLPKASGNAYLDFQLRTRFGTFSFQARPKGSRSKDKDTTDDDRSIHSQEQSPLFQLPSELRLQIYEELLVEKSGSAVKLVHRRAKDRIPTSLTILLACRRTLAEAEDMLYSMNRLCPENPTNFVSSLGPRRRAAIRMVLLLVGSAGSMLGGIEPLCHLPNLTSLHVQRTTSVKYQDVSSWSIMAPQLVTELWKLDALADFELRTPESGPLNEHEITRQKKLDAIDTRLRDTALIPKQQTSSREWGA